MSKFNQFTLLRQNRFAPFFVTQFLGAFNDNIFRNGLIILLTFKSIKILGLNASQLANIAGALFILPYFLFSAIAGQLADKLEKSVLIRSVKLLEIGLMLLAAISLLTENIDLDFIEILIREKFFFGKKNEKVYLLNRYEN